MSNLPVASPDGTDSLSQMLGLIAATRENTSSKSDELSLVRQGKNVMIFRCNSMGKKVFRNTVDNQEEILVILEHERRVSNYLSPGFPHRKVQSLDSYKGCLGFNFDWVEGVTLKAWLMKQDLKRGDQGVDLLSRLPVAIAVVKAVASLHAAGVAHANICSDNIIVSFESKQCSATLIDLAKAVILSDSSASVKNEDACLTNDMKALGSVLYSVLGGEPTLSGQKKVKPVEEDNQTRLKRGRNDEHSVTSMPLYLTSLLSALIAPSLNNVGGTFEYQYQNADDVLHDLQAAAKKPELYLKPYLPSKNAQMSVQVPVDSFYGRLSEVTILKQSLDMVKQNGGQPIVISVSGYAGAGKTALLKQVAKPIAELNGFVITCNFDRTVSPDTVFASALNFFFGESLTCANSEVASSIRSRIRETLGEHVGVLEESIPNLRTYMNDKIDSEQPGSDHVITVGLTQRWQFLLSKLVHAISSESHPIAVVFEDLHWADSDALDTLQKIILDQSIKHCTYYISYRDSDAVAMDNITRMLEGVQSLGLQNYTIRIGPMGKEAINACVSETLCIPPSLSQPLSSVIQKKTGGIILFVTQFIKSLHEIGLIRFSLSTCTWEFDVTKISQIEMSSDIVQHLVERILRLPQNVQVGLQIAACLGPTFDSDSFAKADSNSGLSPDDFFHMVTESGFIQEQESAPGHYTWGHDKIREAAYSLIPVGLLESLHLLVGTRIYIKTKEEQIADKIFVIVRNMNMGLRCLDAENLKSELAHLNFIAGTTSAEKSAFHSATNYFVIGLGLLGEDWYILNYKLGLMLCNAAAEALLVTGNTALIKSVIEKPINQAKNLEDKLAVSHTLVRFLASTGEIEEATAKCFSILHEIGEDFSSDVTSQEMLSELMKTKHVLNEYSEQDFSSLPILETPLKLWAMEFMQLACRIAFYRKPEMIPLIGCRIVQMSAAHGWCPTSAFGMSTFGHGLISINEIDEGHYWVKKGLQLVDTYLKSRELSVEMKSMYHSFISFWKEPFQASREILIDTSQEALMQGQVEFAMSSAFNSCRMSFICGQNLLKGEINCTSLARRMAQLRQIQSSFSLATHHSMILALMNVKDNTRPFSMLDGNIRNEDDLYDFCLKTEKLGIVHAIQSNRLFLAYFFKRHDEAVVMAEKYRRRKMLRFLDVYVEFFGALSALHLARQKDQHEHKWIETAERSIAMFDTWTKHSVWNHQNKRLLLIAEMHRTRGQPESAEATYKASIASAQKHRFDHEAGIAQELLGDFFMEQGKTLDAREQFVSACDCYERWGATALVNQLKKQM